MSSSVPKKVTEEELQDFLEIAFQYEPTQTKYLYADPKWIRELQKWLDPTKAAVRDLLDDDSD
jgi:hypothetical protein